MSDKPVTLIVSDLHLGGGSSDPGDDHVFHKSQFRDFIRQQAETPEGKKETSNSSSTAIFSNSRRSTSRLTNSGRTFSGVRRMSLCKSSARSFQGTMIFSLSLKDSRQSMATVSP